MLRREIAINQRRDYLQCKNSPHLFVGRHCTIETPAGQVIPFEMWQLQLETLTELQQAKKLIVLKARRLGLSWVALSYALWLAIYKQGIRILILCKKEADAAELLDRIRRMLERIKANPLSAHILHGIEEQSKSRDKVTTLDIGASTIKALVGTPAAARSETSGLVICDEFAFQRKASGIWRGLLPTIEGGGQILVISTGDGVRGDAKEFADQWSNAVKGESGFTPIFFPWFAHPDRDEKWKEETIAALGSIERFNSEYPATPDDAFISPDTTLVLSPAGIDAAEKLGKEFGQLQQTGELQPVGGVTHLGIDWGEQTHAVPIWELEAGGIYVPAKEVVCAHVEPSAAAKRMLAAVETIGLPIGQARYDAAGVQSMRTFKAVAPPGIKILKIPFNKYKTEAIGYLRQLFNRAADGHKTKTIAIHPSNTELLRQLRGWALEDPDQDKIDKGDDHGPDSLVAAVAPVAARARKRAKTLTT